MIVNDFSKSGTTATGSWSGTTGYIEGKITCIACKFDTITTTFDISLSDSDGIKRFSVTGCTGEYVRQVNIAVRGNYTIAIANASADENFTTKLDIEE